jgi:hypothetical protein
MAIPDSIRQTLASQTIILRKLQLLDIASTNGVPSPEGNGADDKFWTVHVAEVLGFIGSLTL